jgi:hypothetical protein
MNVPSTTTSVSLATATYTVTAGQISAATGDVAALQLLGYVIAADATNTPPFYPNDVADEASLSAADSARTIAVNQAMTSH